MAGMQHCIISLMATLRVSNPEIRIQKKDKSSTLDQFGKILFVGKCVDSVGEKSIFSKSVQLIALIVG